MSDTGLRHGGTIGRLPVNRIVVIQLAVLVVAAGGLGWLLPSAAFSVMAGGLIEILARAWFGFWAFRYTGASRSYLMVRAFKWGEAGKFILVAASFAALFAVQRDVALPGVLIGYAGEWLVGTIVTAALVSQYRAGA